ncbi:MAG TPA: RNA polymerase sigma factor [Steroidobacteraceae bacterium]|nr:RNA polymerase sigma factor [Steroidobacteraceae bacterium]
MGVLTCPGAETGMGVANAAFEIEPLRAVQSQFRRESPARRVRAMLDVDDGDLMLRYAGGDLRAFEALYRRHRSSLYRYLTRHTRDPEVANDLFQEVWSKVIASRSRYEPRAKFSTFLYRIAHNCFIDHCRRSSARADRMKVNAEDFDLENVLPAPVADHPDARAEHAQTLARYRVALESLPPDQRDTFLLYEESGLTLEEIGAISGVSMETAKSRLRYALTKLRTAMGAQHETTARAPAALEEPGT